MSETIKLCEIYESDLFLIFFYAILNGDACVYAEKIINLRR